MFIVITNMYRILDNFEANPLDLGNSAQPVVAKTPDTGNKALPVPKSVIPPEPAKSSQTASAKNTPSKSGQADWKYPIVRRDQSVVETIHGHKIADPYRWLEDTKSNETKAFVKDQNKLTDSYLSRNSQRDAYTSAVTKLYNGDSINTPMKAGNYYFTFYQSNSDNLSILYKQKSLNAEKTVFLDSNQWDKNDVVSLNRNLFSSSGKYFGYIIRKGGSDWGTIRVRCVENTPHCKAGQDAIDEVKWTKFFNIAWSHDELGFFYTGYLEPSGGDKAANTKTSSSENAKVYYHRLGTQQSSDQLIAEYPEAPTYTLFSWVGDDGRWLVVRVTDNKRNEDVWLARMGKDGSVPKNITFNKIANGMNGYHDYITNVGDRFYFYSDKNAPRFKVITYDMAAPEKGFVDLVPQHEKDILTSANFVGGAYLLLEYMKDAKSALSIHHLSTGKKIRDIPLPMGSVNDIYTDFRHTEVFFSVQSFLSRGTIYRYDAKSNTLSVVNELKTPGFNPEEFETRQVFVKSKDNVEFPMFITARKGISLDKSHPTILFSDGSSSQSQKPQFNTLWGAFLKHFNGIVAVANIRGGGEYGSDWRKDGMLQKKQNTFDDFQSAAKYLSEQGYTKPSLLTLQGVDTGSLLVTTAANQAPELFGCGLTDYGLTDMLRFHKSLFGRTWTTRFGNPDVKSDFEYLLRYSPLHNVNANKIYPALLLNTPDQLDRISPLNSYKLAAELQYKCQRIPIH
ncbi:prolyl oligopeptidase [Syncephalis fuscata]|nr:prolyl oligopeptidase [Syncephalis fuscata]